MASSMTTTQDMTAFSLKIEESVYMNDISYIEAVVNYCEETGFEIETAAKLISNALKAKIQNEAEELHFLAKSETNQLPL
jgi:hypothetical protein